MFQRADKELPSQETPAPGLTRRPPPQPLALAEHDGDDPPARISEQKHAVAGW